jgi:arginine decarboxylase
MTNYISQARTPLLTALREISDEPHAAFYTPGHKRGVGVSQPFLDVFGKTIFGLDLPELTELDNLFLPSGVIEEAQQLAAEAFGAKLTWFLVNGSTCGVEAAILATCGTGDKIILPRNVHSSAIAGLILSGAIPIFVNPEYDAILDITHSITPAAVALAFAQHPDAKVVLMVYPTYYGVCGDVKAIASLAHSYNIPLIVDEAHGAHFAFHPELPMTALAAGADICIQSTHKTLGAMTQASMLHLQGSLVDSDRITKALQLVQSTSPSYILMASLDAARSQMAIHGKELISRTLQLADDARKRIDEIPKLSIFHSPPSQGGLGGSNSGFINFDRTRLTVTVSGLGLTGFEADEILETQLSVRCELASLQNVTFIISLGNTQEDIDKLVDGFSILARKYSKASLPKPLFPIKEPSVNFFEVENTLVMSPREAFFAATETLPLEKTPSRICAEIICPYPPGIPILMPGEIITQGALNYLQQIQAMGGLVTGCADNSLKTLKVVCVN